MKPPVFIVGAPRSGTGLLRNLLRSHPSISIPAESHFVPHFYRAYGDPSSEEEALALAKRILTFSRVKRWQLSLTPEDLSEHRSYRDLVAGLYTAWARSEGKPRWGDKTPHYVEHLPVLAEIFGDVKILHIIRDGRAVASSWAAHPMGPGNHWAAAKSWQARVHAGRRGAALLPADSYQEVRYEALLADPDTTLREVYAFLDEDLPEAPAQLNSPPLPWDPRWRGVSLTEIVRDNADAWRERISARQRGLIEAAAGDLLVELGYLPEGGVSPVHLWKRSAFRAHALARHYRRLLQRPQRLVDNLALFFAQRRARARTGEARR